MLAHAGCWVPRAAASSRKAFTSLSLMGSEAAPAWPGRRDLPGSWAAPTWASPCPQPEAPARLGPGRDLKHDRTVERGNRHFPA